MNQVGSYLFRDNSQPREELFLQVSEEYVFAFLMDQQAKELKDRFFNLEMEQLIRKPGHSRKDIIGFTEGEGWNNDHFGPLRIPEVGETITADYGGLYQNLGVQKGETFVIEEPLYFVMGDNRNNAIDSRMIGFIPRFKIVAVVEEK
ncbi:MAG: S26 family signal peptidase [Bacteroidia bacterium]